MLFVLFWLWFVGGGALAQTSGALDLELSLEAGQDGQRVVHVRSELKKTFTIDALTLAGVAGFVQEGKTPKTTSSKDERALQLMLEWVFTWGDLNACWQQSDVRFPEAAQKDKANQSLCLQVDLNGDPLSLKGRFEDKFEVFANAMLKNRNDRTFLLEGQLELGTAKLEEGVKLKGISFLHNPLKEVFEQTFETRLEGPLWGALWALSRKDVQKAFPKTPVKDNHQTTYRVQMTRTFGALTVKVEQVWARKAFALDFAKNSLTQSLDANAQLALDVMRLDAAFEEENVVFQNDPLKDKRKLLRAVEVQWEADRWKVGVAFEARNERFFNNPPKDKRQRIWKTKVSLDLKPHVLFAPERLSIEIEKNEQRFPHNPAKDVLQAALQVEARVQLTETLDVALSSSVKRRQFNNSKASTTKINVDVEIKTVF